MTGVCWMTWTPRCIAPCAYAHTTRSWRAVARREVVRGAEHRIPAAAGQVELRDQLLDLAGLTITVSAPQACVHQRARALGAHRHLGVRQPEQALGRMHDRGAGLVLQALVQLEAALVERGPLRGCRSWRG